MQLLIDGDILLYRSVQPCEIDASFEDRYIVRMADLDACIHNAESLIEDLTDISGASDVLIAFSCCSSNFRKEYWPQYKSKRGTGKPVAFWHLKEYLEDNYDHEELRGLEADDVLGILQTIGTTCIWSQDKDLKQVPGWHVSLDTLEWISEEEGRRFHLWQTLVGDQVDGYSGCKGVGPVGANKILDKDCSWQAVVAAYHKAGLTEEDALDNARMAFILRPDYYVNGEVKLWTPTAA